MESNCRTSWSRVIMLMLVSFASADLAKDRDECATVLVGLATCLPYVSGTAKTPTPDCCTGLKQVLVQNKKCLCVLVKDRNDPQLGLKINVTLALGLPGTCHAPANTSGCPALLHLAPNSPDAQVFEQFANSTKGNAPAPVSAAKGTPVNPSNAKDTSEGRKIKRWFVIEITGGLAVWYLSSVLGI